MDHKGKTGLTGKDCDVVENCALDDVLNLGKCVGGRVQTILVLDLQLSQDCYPIDTLIRFAARAGLDPDKFRSLSRRFSASGSLGSLHAASVAEIARSASIKLPLLPIKSSRRSSSAAGCG